MQSFYQHSVRGPSTNHTSPDLQKAPTYYHNEGPTRPYNRRSNTSCASGHSSPIAPGIVRLRVPAETLGPRARRPSVAAAHSTQRGDHHGRAEEAPRDPEAGGARRPKPARRSPGPPHPRRPLPRRRPEHGRLRRGQAGAHRREPQDHRGRHPRRHVGHRHQHAGEAARPRRGRPDRLHRRVLRRAPRDRRPRALHRHPRARDRVAGPPGQALPHLHGGAVQGALARGDGRPLLQHAVRHRAQRRGRAQGAQEHGLVPGALLHAPRRLRPLGRGLRRLARGLLPRAAHRRHRQPRHHLLLGRRVPRGRARPGLQRRRGGLPAQRGRAR